MLCNYCDIGAVRTVYFKSKEKPKNINEMIFILNRNTRFIVDSLDSDCNSNDYRGEFSSSSSNESKNGSPSRQPSEQNKVSDGDLIEKTNKGYLCTICKKTFTLARNCRRHVDTIHFRQIKDPPKFRGEEFDFENSLQQSTIFKSNEIKTNIQYWPFGSRIYSKPTAWSLVECKLCNTNFKTCKQLRQHLENHRDIETLYSLELTDNIVQYLFPNMIDLNLIKDNIIKDIRKKQWFKYYTVVNKYTYEMSISDTEEEDLEEESTERANKYKCAFCTKGFSYKYLVHSHLNEAHKMEVIPFKCSHCQLKFVSIKMYNQHLQTHCLNLHKVLLCQNCPGKFVWPENIKNHTCATKLTAILPAPPKEHEKTPKHQEHLLPLPVIAILRCCLCEHSFQKLQHLRQHMPLHADGKTGIDFKGCIYVKQFENSKPIDYEMLQQQIKNNYSKCQISRFYQAMDKYGNEMDISDSDSDICKEEFQNVEKEYKCEVCNDVYKNRKYLLKHQQERHSNVNMPFTCKDCKQQYVSIHLLQQHLKRECSNENRRTAQQCEFCNVRFIWPNNLLKHKEIMHGIIIEPSSSTSSSGSSLLPKTVTTAAGVTSDTTTTDTTQTTPKTDRKFVCLFCRVSYSNNSTLTVHIMTQHTDEKPFKCAHCDMAFKRANDLQSHRLTHPGEHPLKCTFCEKSFSRLIELKTHKRTHKNDLINQCTICQKSFKRPFSLKLHMFTHTGEKPYKCDICGKTFVCSAYLQKHREMVCNDLWSTPVNVPDCKVLENPTKNVKTKKLCPICGIYLSKNTSLTNHVRTHTGYKPFKCDLCEMSFLRRGDLLDHRRKHTKERPFECPHCDKSFAKKQSLTNHIRLHTGERPYQCTICKKSFNKSDYLKIHMRGHTGEKPFKCNFCGQGFICGAYLKKHQISKGHLDENKYSTSSNESKNGSPSSKPIKRNYVVYDQLVERSNKSFICTICKKTYNLLKNCRRHVGIIHFPPNKESPKINENSLQKSRLHKKDNEIKMKDQTFGSRIYSKPTAWGLVECKLCNTTFKTCKQLRQHLENHSDIETLYSLELTDNIVQYFFPNMIDLNLIKDNIIKDIRKKQWFKYYTVLNEYSYEMCISDTEEEDLEEEFTERANNYKCAFCAKQFSYKFQVYSHLKKAHRKKEIPLKCSHCKLEFISIKMYNQHVQTHCHNQHKVLQCGNCPGKFVWPENIKNHTCTTKLSAPLPPPPQTKKESKEHLQPLSTTAIFRCCLCEHSFQKLQHLRQHMTLHADGKTGIDFEGCIYVKQFENSKTIDYEMFQQQIKNYYSKCQIGRFYQAMDKYGNEMDISDSDSDSCKEEFENVEKEYKCEVCKKIYKNLKYLLKHQQERHSNVNMPFTCKDCKQQYVSIHLLQQHLKRECPNGNRQTAQQCEFCNVRFIWPHNLITHKEIMHRIMIEPSSSISSSGSSTVTTAAGVTSDTKTTDMILVSKVLDDTTTLTVCKQATPKTDRKFVCSFCRVSFPHKSTLTLHVKKRHTAKKPFKCDDCEMWFIRAADLKSHRLTQSHHLTHSVIYKRNKHLCPVCGVFLSGNTSLSEHVRRHTDYKPFKCDICERVYPCKSDLMNHQRKHSNDRPYKCPHCDRSFKVNCSLTSHILTHTGERPHHCTFCKKSYNRLDYLKIHLRSHTGEKPFKCDFCEETFISGAYLKRHRLSKGHHVENK